MFDYAVRAAAATLDSYSVAGSRDAEGTLRPGVCCRGLDGKRRFHDEMQAAAGTDQQSEILRLGEIVRAPVCTRHIEDADRVFK